MSGKSKMEKRGMKGAMLDEWTGQGTKRDYGASREISTCKEMEAGNSKIDQTLVQFSKFSAHHKHPGNF